MGFKNENNQLSTFLRNRYNVQYTGILNHDLYGVKNPRYKKWLITRKYDLLIESTTTKSRALA